MHVEAPAKRACKLEGRSFNVDCTTTEKAGHCVIEVRAEGTTSPHQDAVQRGRTTTLLQVDWGAS